jgi:rare lipoprotein A
LHAAHFPPGNGDSEAGKTSISEFVLSFQLMGQQRRMARRVLLSAVVALLVLLGGCRKNHRVAHIPAAPQPRAPNTAVALGYTEEGVASWYGIPFDGRRAADGEIFRMENLVAAHRLLPFNTWLKVTNLANNRSVNVRVIDRGPFVHGRIIDLSMGAARQIGLLGAGIGRVRLEVIAAPPENPASEYYAVQVGAFSIRASAERAEAAYAQRYGTARLAVKQGPVPLWRVLVGKEPSIEAAQRLAASLRAEDRNVFVVRLDPGVASVSSE